ncbi:MAG: BMP family ABC transporter substrate-binding protein, partial [Oscillospiraceae bacterium]
GAIKVKYNYCGSFNPAPEFQTLASSWYNDGVEVIFACAGGVGNSVMAAAEAIEGKKVIGVDVDQYAESETVITSATKGLRTSVSDLIGKYYNDEFPGGENLVLAADQNGVNLPMENSKFEKFTQEDYDVIFAALVENKDGILDTIKKDTDVETVTEIKTSKVVVTLI